MKRSGAKKQPRNLKGWVWLGAITIGLLTYSYLAIALTTANVAAQRAPSVALRFWPNHALAHARSADLESRASESGVSDAASHARAALAINPTLAPALRVLSLEAASRGNVSRADTLMELSSRLSRRDLQTQLWQIEQAVRLNDVSSALHHYAAALRVSPGARSILFPSLANGAVVPELVDPVADLAAREQTWRNAFLTYLVGNSNDSLRIAVFFDAIAERRAVLPGNLVEVLAKRLIASGNLNAAAQLYHRFDPGWRSDDLSHQLDGGFDRSGTPPFGWSFAEGVTFVGPREENDSDKALHVYLQSGEPVTIAQRLLILGLGNYRLSGTYNLPAGEGGATLRATLSCSASGHDTGTSVDLSPDKSDFSVNLAEVGCRAAWLTLSTSTHQGETRSMWIDDLRLTKVGGS